MVKNIEMVLERGEKLELLVDKTDRLNATAFTFERSNDLDSRRAWSLEEGAFTLTCLILGQPPVGRHPLYRRARTLSKARTSSSERRWRVRARPTACGRRATRQKGPFCTSISAPSAVKCGPERCRSRSSASGRAPCCGSWKRLVEVACRGRVLIQTR